jgi:hypothetical protein
MDVSLPASLTSVPVLAGAGAVALALLVGIVLAVVHRRGERRRTPSTPMPDYWLHPVRPEVARQLQGRWDALQRDFVDAPSDTLRRADALVAEAMRERGYPAVDAEGRAQLLRDHEPAHAAVYDELRQALGEDESSWSTERRRRALLQVRTLFDAILRDEDDQPRLFAA